MIVNLTLSPSETQLGAFDTGPSLLTVTLGVEWLGAGLCLRNRVRHLPVTLFRPRVGLLGEYGTIAPERPERRSSMAAYKEGHPPALSRGFIAYPLLNHGPPTLPHGASLL